MNPNQMMMAKAMVAQEALRQEADESQRRRRNGRSRGAKGQSGVLGLLRRR